MEINDNKRFLALSAGTLVRNPTVRSGAIGNFKEL